MHLHCQKQLIRAIAHIAMLLALGVVGFAAFDEHNLDYILDRYVDSSGGRLGYKEMQSLRVTGIVNFQDGSACRFIALKKKPNLCRITFVYMTHRVIQGYDGTTTWWMIETPTGSRSGIMDEKSALDFIREAPILNPLIDHDKSSYRLFLEAAPADADEEYFRIRVEYTDGWKKIYQIDRKTFRDVRILNLTPESELVDMVVPLKFDFYEGILFSTEVSRIKEGEILNSLSIEKIEINPGILDSIFTMPEPQAES